MSGLSISLSNQVQNYLITHSVKPNKIKESLREYTSKVLKSNMHISAEQGQFMRVLIQLIGAKKAIEVGTFTGYSALCIAEALPKDGKLIACDINKDWTNIAKEFWKKSGVDYKIDLHLCPATETMQQLINNAQEESFDFIFIDADKTNYKNYYELGLKLLRKGGIIAIDNVLWEGAVAYPTKAGDESTKAIKDFNKHIFRDSRVEMSMIPIGDGLTIACKI